jgi:hypothetical protein
VLAPEAGAGTVPRPTVDGIDLNQAATNLVSLLCVTIR